MAPESGDRKSITQEPDKKNVNVPAADAAAAVSLSNDSQGPKKNEKRGSRLATWVSEEYRLAALNADAPGFKPPHYKPPRVSSDFYLSSQYKSETKKRSDHPWEPIKGAFLSEEYRKYYPIPPISIPGCPVGSTPADGPWVEFYDSMWGKIWVSLKDTDTAEASKESEWSGFDWRKDHVA